MDQDFKDSSNNLHDAKTLSFNMHNGLTNGKVHVDSDKQT